jgi:hypothetical protein
MNEKLGTELVPAEKARLAELESVVERGLQTLVTLSWRFATVGSTGRDTQDVRDVLP